MYFKEGSSLYEATKDHDHFVARIAHVCHCKILPNFKSLSDILIRQYSFPEHSRTLMWRYLLRLPNNDQQYQVIARQPLHKDVLHLEKTIPVKYTSISRRIIRIMSFLVYWHPPLAECDWLPGLVYPFLSIFGRTKISVVETIMTVIYNWCSEWIMFIPNPPVTVLSRIEKIAKQMGGFAPLNVAWPALRSFFGEVAKTDSALILLDNILASRPLFLEYLVASYACLKDREINSSNVRSVINRARKYYEKNWENNHNHSSFTPLSEGFYPILSIAEKSEMWKIQQLERIRADAAALHDQLDLKNEIEKETAMIDRKRNCWFKQREVLLEIESEQMANVRRGEKETLEKENLNEQASIEEKKIMIENKRILEENNLVAYTQESKETIIELEEMTKMRKETWSKWIELKEESAKVSKQETDLEMELLNKRDTIQTEQSSMYHKVSEESIVGEQEVVSGAIRRNQELENEKNEQIEVLERARIKKAQDSRSKKKKNSSQ